MGSNKEGAMLSDAPTAEQSIEDATSEELSSDESMNYDTTEASSSVDVDVSTDMTVDSN